MTQLDMTAHQVLPVLGRRVLVDGYHLVLDLERSAGGWLHDARDGKAYLDFFSFFASNPLGMNHPDMTDPRFLEQLARERPLLADRDNHRATEPDGGKPARRSRPASRISWLRSSSARARPSTTKSRV